MPDELNEVPQDDDQELAESQDEQPVEGSEEQSEEQPSEDTGEEYKLFNMSDEEYEKFAESASRDSSREQPSVSNEATQDTSSPQINYEQFYNTVMSPFKANGKDVQPSSAADVRRLMQMGSGYNKRMEQLKPIRKTAETLKKAGIDNSTLNLLIDINNGNKEALKTFLKQKNIEPTELDLDEIDYKPANNFASDDDVEFSDVLLDINDSLPKINNLLDTKWDAESKRKLLANPNLLRGLHTEFQLGRFDKIEAEVDRRRALGNYVGVSNLDAYIDTVTGLFVAAQKQSAQQSQGKGTRMNERAKKMKAAPNRGISAPRTIRLTNNKLASLSDEDFEKLTL